MLNYASFSFESLLTDTNNYHHFTVENGNHKTPVLLIVENYRNEPLFISWWFC
jgi:hypothetical protein